MPVPPASSAEPHSRRPAPPGLRRDADFRRLWVGQTASQLGEHTSLVILPLLAVLTLDAGAGQLGVLRAVGQAPILLLSLFAGAWVDRWRTRTTMVLTDGGRALALGAVAAAGSPACWACPACSRSPSPSAPCPCSSTWRTRRRSYDWWRATNSCEATARWKAAVTVPALLAVGFVFGLGGQLVNVTIMAVRQAVTPDGLQGRAAATITFAGMGLTPLGSLAGGFHAEEWGLRTGLLVTAAGMLLSPVVMALSSLARLGRELPAPHGTPPTAGRTGSPDLSREN